MRKLHFSLLFLIAITWHLLIWPCSQATAQTSKNSMNALVRQTRAELFRIFSLRDKDFPQISVDIASRDELSLKTHIQLSAVYINDRIYISETIANSWKLRYALRHEMMHWLIDKLSNGNCPAWLDEGLAQYFSGPVSRILRDTSDKRRDALSSIALSSLVDGFSRLDEDSLLLAYARSRAAAQSLVFRHTLPSVRDYLIALGNGEESEAAFRRIFGESSEMFDKSTQK